MDFQGAAGDHNLSHYGFWGCPEAAATQAYVLFGTRNFF
jgi:hypothetical protein